MHSSDSGSIASAASGHCSRGYPLLVLRIAKEPGVVAGAHSETRRWQIASNSAAVDLHLLPNKVA